MASHRALSLVALFVVVPTLLYGIPAAAGVLWLAGDNLIQNYPLRVLVGIDLARGHLPLWDPFLWSGTPLLAGFNAAAAYPFTWLFGFIPSGIAWVANQVLVQVIAAIGMLVLLRVLGRSWLASSLAAAAYAYGGFMAGQSVHLDLVEAAAWLPWAFAALHRLASRPRSTSAAPWVALLGVSLGMMVLSGAVEPILDGALVLGVFWLWLVWRTPSRRSDLIIGALAGAALGAMIGSLQLLPGSHLAGNSQRAHATYTYFKSGSMAKGLTLLILDPFALGGGHTFPAAYFGTYNLPEVSSYIGILPVMAFFGLLARRHIRSPEAKSWLVWYVIALLGLLLAWGGFTPFGHVMYYIPLFNRQRLLNRNLVEVDLALAVIFGTWLDTAILPQESTGAGRARLRSEVLLALLPVAGVVGVQVAMALDGPSVVKFLGAAYPIHRSMLWPLVAFLTLSSAICLAAGAIVVWRKHAGRRLPWLLTALVAVDLVSFNVVDQQAPDPSAATSPSSTSANELHSALVATGYRPAHGSRRVAIFDPDRYYPIQLEALGEPDLTILRRISSVQGYGAIVSAAYDSATHSHLQLDLKPSVLAGSLSNELDLGLLASAPQYFAHMVVPPPSDGRGLPPTGSVPLPPVAAVMPRDRIDHDQNSQLLPARIQVLHVLPRLPRSPASDYGYARRPPRAVMVASGATRTAFFGTDLVVTSAVIPASAVRGTPERGMPTRSGPLVRTGLLLPDGKVRWAGAPARIDSGHALEITLDEPQLAIGIVTSVAGTGGAEVGNALVRTAGEGIYRLDGSLTDAVTPPHWRFYRMDGVFALFVNPYAAGRAWVETASGDPIGGATARVVHSSPWGAEQIRVTTPEPALVVRSEAYSAGWSATVRPLGHASPGGTRGVHATGEQTVLRHGILQAVRVPAGIHTVTFSYKPRTVTIGIVLSGLGALLAGLLGLWPVIRRRRRQHVRDRTVAGDPLLGHR